jgi:membrane-associated phospholipid phosphatase
MEPLLSWGLEIIRSIQHIQSPLLNTFFLTITSLGSSLAFLLVLPLLFWCVDYNLGMRVAIVCSISAFFNFSLKDFFAQPRPFNLDPSVAITTARGYGLPSGHAQGSLVLWGSIAAWAKKKWVWAVTAAFVALTGFSRVYLGVHFPTDVLAGWGLGIVFLALYCTLQPKIESWITGQTLVIQLFILLIVSLGLLLINFNRIMVYQLGMLVGIGVGVMLKARYVSFSVSGTRWTSIARYGIGITILFTLFTTLRTIYPAQQATGYFIFGFLHSAVNGLWISLGAPWLFRLLKI